MSFGLTLALLASTAIGAEWRIVEVAGVVRVAEPGRDAAAGRLNAVLPIGSSVTTAAGGRASLDNGLQRIVVGPNSRMTIAPETTSGMTRIAQDLGAILFQVDKKKAPHFRVDTPLLAAVVKGTTFTVVVDVQSDTVNVAEGLVEVRSNAGSMSQDVPGGATASVMRDAPQSVKMSAIAASTPESAPAVIEPLDYGAVSGGLVEVAGLPAGAPQTQQAGPVAADGRGSQASLGAPSSQIGGIGSMSPASSMVAEQSRNSVHPTGSLPGQGGDAAGAGNGNHPGDSGPSNGAAGGASPEKGAGDTGGGNVGLGLGNGNSGGASNPGNGNPGNGNPGNGNPSEGAGNPANGNAGGGNGSGGNLSGGSGNGNSGATGNPGAGSTSGLAADAGESLGNGNSGGTGTPVTGASGNSNGGGLSADAGVGLGNGNSSGGTGNPVTGASGNSNTGGLGADAGVSLGNGNSGSGTGASGNPGGGGDAGVNVTDPVTGLVNGLRVKK